MKILEAILSQFFSQRHFHLIFHLFIVFKYFEYKYFRHLYVPGAIQVAANSEMNEEDPADALLAFIFL